MPAKRQIKKKVKSKSIAYNDSHSEGDDDEEIKDDDTPVQGLHESDKAIKDRLGSVARKMERERAAVWKSVQRHEKEYKERIKGIDLHFKQSINEAFTQFKDTELYIDDEIARYMDAFGVTVGAIETSLQHISHYLDKRHGGPEIIRLDQSSKDLTALTEKVTAVLDEINAKQMHSEHIAVC